MALGQGANFSMASAEADRSLQFDSIFVLELLGPSDLKTGDALFRSTIQPKGIAEGIHTAYVSVSSTDRLIPDLWAVSSECKRRGLSPIIHIDTHGTKDESRRHLGSLLRNGDGARVDATGTLARLGLVRTQRTSP